MLAQRLQSLAYRSLNDDEPVINRAFDEEGDFDHIFGSTDDQGPLGELLRPLFLQRLAPVERPADDVSENLRFAVGERLLSLGMVIRQPEKSEARPILDFVIGMLPLSELWDLSQFYVSFSV